MDMAIEAQDIATRIREFIVRNLIFSTTGFNYGDDASLMNEGIIDSIGVIELVSFVEEQFAISVADRELVPDNFDSVDRLTRYVSRKLEEKV